MLNSREWGMLTQGDKRAYLVILWACGRWSGGPRSSTFSITGS